MARNIASRGWLGLIVTVVVLGGIAVVAIWMSLSGSTNPDYQASNERPGMGGQYFVNLWVDPNPPDVGDAEIRAKLTSSIGTGMEVDRLELAVRPPDADDPVQLDTEQRMEDGSDDQVFVAGATFNQSGTWQVVVDYSFGGPDLSEQFAIEVNG